MSHILLNNLPYAISLFFLLFIMKNIWAIKLYLTRNIYLFFLSALFSLSNTSEGVNWCKYMEIGSLE